VGRWHDTVRHKLPEIDWSGYNQQFMSAQLAKSASFFASLDQRMDLMHKDIKKLAQKQQD
jgi:hypothetical protein